MDKSLEKSLSEKGAIESDDLTILLNDAKTNVHSLEALTVQFMPLILKAAKYYSYTDELYSDAIAEGTLAFINCIEKYPISSKIPFPYYAKRAVYSHIRYYASREISRLDNLVSIDSKVKGCDSITIEDTISSGTSLEDEYFEKSSLLEIIDCIQNLSEVERQVLERHYFLGHSLKKISEEIGYSYRGVKYAKFRGIKALQSKFSCDDY